MSEIPIYPTNAPPPDVGTYSFEWTVRFRDRTTGALVREVKFGTLPDDAIPVSHYTASSAYWRHADRYDITLEAGETLEELEARCTAAAMWPED